MQHHEKNTHSKVTTLKKKTMISTFASIFAPTALHKRACCSEKLELKLRNLQRNNNTRNLTKSQNRQKQGSERQMYKWDGLPLLSIPLPNNQQLSLKIFVEQNHCQILLRYTWFIIICQIFNTI